MDKKKILSILAAVFVLSVFYRIFTAPEEKKAPLKYKTGAKISSELRVRGSELKTGKDMIPRIELSRLLSIKRKPPSDGVNLFHPFFIVEPPPPPKPVVALPQPVDPVEEELKLFRFMGFLEKTELRGRDKKIFLAKGQNIYIVKSGDTIEEKFKVHIMEKMVEVSGIDSEKKIAIPLEEK